MDLLERFKSTSWKRINSYKIVGGFNEVYIADNGDKIILSTCEVVDTKYFIKGVSRIVFKDVDIAIKNYLYKNFPN